MDKKFYERTWFIVMCCIIFPPAGIFLIWKNKKPDRKNSRIFISAILCLWTLVLVIAGAHEDDLPNANEDKQEEKTIIEKEIEENEKQESEEKENDSSGITEYNKIFVLDLLEKWGKNKGSGVIVSFKAESIDERSDYYSVSSKNYDETHSKIEIEIDGEPEILEGDWITVSGIVSDEQYNGLENAKIESVGKDSKKSYEDGKAKYDKRKKNQAEKREKNFRKKAEPASYDDLMRYPDTYEDKKIKVVVNITEVEPDGIIFPGDIQGTLEGKEIAVYDEREVKEPKLAKGDTVTIYGKGNGLTTVKVKQKSGIFSKTVDKYNIPGISIKYMDLQ